MTYTLRHHALRGASGERLYWSSDENTWVPYERAEHFDDGLVTEVALGQRPLPAPIGGFWTRDKVDA